MIKLKQTAVGVFVGALLIMGASLMVNVKDGAERYIDFVEVKSVSSEQNNLRFTSEIDFKKGHFAFLFSNSLLCDLGYGFERVATWQADEIILIADPFKTTTAWKFPELLPNSITGELETTSPPAGTRCFMKSKLIVVKNTEDPTKNKAIERQTEIFYILE